MADPNHMLTEDYPDDPRSRPLDQFGNILPAGTIVEAPKHVQHYVLTWTAPGRDSAITYQLDPSWTGHDDMIKGMSLLERRILKVWLETVVESIDRAGLYG